MKPLQAIRGMHDIIGEDMQKMLHIKQTARQMAQLNNFQEMCTPILEFTEVFSRTLGEAADIITKEMYTFTDRNGDSLTLRPEGTAPLVRAFLSEGLEQHLPLRVWYTGAMFRHERPQKGRLRQFHQVGFEILGEKDVITDAELIIIAVQWLERLGIKDYTVEINTLGDKESRESYTKALKMYLKEHHHQLSAESKERLEKNPLRILDSKESQDIPIIKNAPVMQEYRTTAAQDFFDKVQAYLTDAQISYGINPNLVRGLDYYTHTVFEIKSPHLGTQATLVAGGRYDGLVEQMGGKPTPAVGFAAGIERLALIMPWTSITPKRVAIIPMDDTITNKRCYQVMQQLHTHNINTHKDSSGDKGKRLKRANKYQCSHTLFVQEQDVILKTMESGTQHLVSLEQAINILKE